MASTYHLHGPAAITGRYLSHNGESRVVRAFLAADLHSGAKQLVKPTMLQSAFLAGVNRTYAHWATKRQAERFEIEAGLVPLVPPPVSKANGSMLPMSITGMPDAELIDFVKSIGINRVLNAACAVEAAQ
jgi:hypothetical protein